jgi:hypothetical protein
MREFTTVAEAGEAYLREYAQMYPRERAADGFFPFGAAYMGLHAGDGQVTDYRPEAVARRLAALDAWGAELDAVAARATTPDDVQDIATLRWVRGAETFALRELQPQRTHPLHYNDTIDVSGYIRRTYAPLDERLRGLLSHLLAIPEALEVARANLDGPLPVISVRQARQSFRGHIYFLQKDLLEAVSASSDRTLVGQIEQAAEVAINAIADLVEFLGEKEREESATSRWGRSASWGCWGRSSWSICRWMCCARLGRPTWSATARRWRKRVARSTRRPTSAVRPTASAPTTRHRRG